MPDTTRRHTVKTLLTGAVGYALPSGAAVAAETPAAPQLTPRRTLTPRAPLPWARGIENQRQADLGDGRFLNPIMAGDRADPTILRDGADYYMTFSSFDAYPGVVIWHSRDLVNWRPLTAALSTPIGSVWACDLVKHEGRYYIYIPARTQAARSIYVVHAERIEGPWSEPIDLRLPAHIDPGHVVGEDGKRYLFLSGGDRVRLTSDGLATDGPVEHVYDPWRYPDDWDVESFSPEGPKVLRHGDFFYMLTAVGGTAGPPTGHMVIGARARSIHGPWEQAPGNPLMRTRSADEKWWSRGHATLVQAPDETWWMVYHGYENAFWTLGRQTLLDPVEWTQDGWLRVLGGDLSQPIRKPGGGRALPHGMPLSDDFSTNKFGIQWAFYQPAADEKQRARYEGQTLVIRGKGREPNDCSPLTFIAGDQAYEMEADIEVTGKARAGVLMFYNRRLYCGLGFDAESMVMHRYGLERNTRKTHPGRRLRMRIRNVRHIVTIHTSADGKEWSKFGVQMETSGYHHNTMGDFLSLRPGIYVAGEGEAIIRGVKYRAL